MKALVVGGGSIGARHLRNLRAAGVSSLGVAEPAAERRAQLAAETGARGFASLADGLAWGPDLAVIATPSHLHVEQALEAARHGCDLFVEKPLAHSCDGLDALAGEVRARGLVSLVGCNMRFHPGPARVKALLDEGRIGRVLFARVHTGSYLPSWRPAQPYAASYSASAAQGGGCILDCIHEIDLARWYMGEVRDVFCAAGRLSGLEIDAEDVAALVCTHADGTLSEVHLDYVQRTYERGCQIVGEGGSITWDYRAGCVRWYEAAADRWTAFAQPDGWEVNQMYVDELRHLLGCLETRAATALPVAEGAAVVRVALAAKASARLGRRVPAAGACEEAVR